MTQAEFHRLFKLVSDKAGSDYSSREDIDDFAHISQLSYFSMLIGNYKQQQAGRPVAPVVVGQTSRPTEELSPFRTKITFFTAPYDATTTPYGVTNGELAMPLDYEHMSAVLSLAMDNGVARERGVVELDDEEWANRADSSLIVPSKLNAIYRYSGKGGTLNGVSIGEKVKLEFRPKDISGHLFYYRTPRRPFYSYTLVGRVETHDPSASVDLEWGEVPAMNILVRALELAGVRQADQLLIGAMRDNKMTEE